MLRGGRWRGLWWFGDRAAFVHREDLGDVLLGEPVLAGEQQVGDEPSAALLFNPGDFQIEELGELMLVDDLWSAGRPL
ncbi:hypothetical protein AB0395_44880 [Streptosporangium sp. NPDC051023]|uniref:hypothetical protein n=1 Tax=Streptosporangium sp. NPDC051023 TaxID=3155410 RepID=UPI00344DBDE1